MGNFFSKSSNPDQTTRISKEQLQLLIQESLAEVEKRYAIDFDYFEKATKEIVNRSQHELNLTMREALSSEKILPNLKFKSSEKLPVQTQIKKLFALHYSADPTRDVTVDTENLDELPANAKVIFMGRFTKSPNFFKTGAVFTSAARQHTLGLPPEIWFIILSYLCLIEGDYSLAPELTKGYEVLMKLRVLLDLYVDRKTPIKREILYDDFLNAIPAVIRQAFFSGEENQSDVGVGNHSFKK